MHADPGVAQADLPHRASHNGAGRTADRSADRDDVAGDSRFWAELDRTEHRDDLVGDLSIDPDRTEHCDDLTVNHFVAVDVDAAEDADPLAHPVTANRFALILFFRGFFCGRAIGRSGFVRFGSRLTLARVCCPEAEHSSPLRRVEVRKLEHDVGVRAKSLAQLGARHRRSVYRDSDVGDFDHAHVAHNARPKADAVAQRDDFESRFDPLAKRARVAGALALRRLEHKGRSRRRQNRRRQ